MSDAQTGSFGGVARVWIVQETCRNVRQLCIAGKRTHNLRPAMTEKGENEGERFMNAYFVCSSPHM